MTNLTHGQSNHNRAVQWPDNAVPRPWVEKLFSRMTAFYGARFADLWSPTDIEGVKREWGIELARLPVEAVRNGLEALRDVPKPPTLPEFIQHCREAHRACNVSQNRFLEAKEVAHSPPPPELAEKIEVASRKMRDKVPNAEWAFKVMIRCENEEIPYNVVRAASDAVASMAGASVIAACNGTEKFDVYSSIRKEILWSRSEGK